MQWNFGDMIDAVAGVVPGTSPALIHGERIVSWSEFDRRTNNIARNLHENGAVPGDKVAFYMRNQPEYTESLAACLRGRLVHVNVNYRYKDEELHYIFDNSDAKTVIYDAEFRPNVIHLQHTLPKVETWLEVGGDDNRPQFAQAYESFAARGSGKNLDIERSPDDQLFLYTGGTTGMPKAVMWTHDILRQASLDALRALGDAPEDMDQFLAAVETTGRHARQIPACPLMHGTGLFTAIATFTSGGTIVTLAGKSGFDPDQLWEAVDRHGVTSLAIVGDVFAKPMLRALDDNPGKYNVSTIQTITSSGVMWSMEVKKGLLKHMPGAMMVDSFGASEAVGFGTSIMTAEGEIGTGKFLLGSQAKVFTEDGREVEPGSGEPGFVARGGHVPLGYYKDEEKTAKTFKTINGVRYSIPGDWCLVEADGSLTLLGRGSVCINTGGEKVYPEEVEEILKEHDAVEDALVVGVPDERWGQAVVAVVELNHTLPTEESLLREYVRARLAGYKVPKRILVTANLGRAANGKADYKGVTEFAKRELGLAS